MASRDFAGVASVNLRLIELLGIVHHYEAVAAEMTIAMVPTIVRHVAWLADRSSTAVVGTLSRSLAIACDSCMRRSSTSMSRLSDCDQTLAAHLINEVLHTMAMLKNLLHVGGVDKSVGMLHVTGIEDDKVLQRATDVKDHIIKIALLQVMVVFDVAFDGGGDSRLACACVSKISHLVVHGQRLKRCGKLANDVAKT